MNIMFFDLSLLALFVIATSIFLYKKRKKVKREGILLLYHTKWGVKLIDKFGEKHKKLLKVLSYISVFVGYILMILMLYFTWRILWIYIFQSSAVQAIKIPPIAPLIPYLPQIFHLSFLPPFYFSYWIIILAIVAITHEFSHGIFARAANIKTDTTGFGFFPSFFPIFPVAFVSPDEKDLEKAKTFEQKAVLSAGTFANIITAIIGLLLMAGFFTLAFAPTGVVYNGYAYGIVNVTNISSINGIPVHNVTYENLVNLTKPGSPNKILVGNQTFAGIKGYAGGKEIALYYDAPAIENNLSGAITKINGEKITNIEKLSIITKGYSPGENITISLYNGTNYNKTITLGTSPEGKSWIGIEFPVPNNSGILAKISNFITSFKKQNVYYKEKFPGAEFIYNLLWWLVFISFSVAIINMLPVGIFDGGRFFYLTVFELTKSEKVAEKAYKFMTYLFILLLVVLMALWVRTLF